VLPLMGEHDCRRETHNSSSNDQHCTEVSQAALVKGHTGRLIRGRLFSIAINYIAKHVVTVDTRGTRQVTHPGSPKAHSLNQCSPTDDNVLFLLSQPLNWSSITSKGVGHSRKIQERKNTCYAARSRTHTACRVAHTHRTGRKERVPAAQQTAAARLCCVPVTRKRGVGKSCSWESLIGERPDWQRREAALLAEIITACALAWTSGTPS
jgi:crotonobetainyl-CoA:carnitine CoA-transferase CaiB-like acyl-CoA transferase